MISFNAKNVFDQIKPDYKIRADGAHPLDLFLGKTDDGRPFIELIGSFTPIMITSTSAIIVKQGEYINKKNSIRFILGTKELVTYFYRFVEDFVISSFEINDPKTGYSFLVNRFQCWKKAFGKSEGLSVASEQGLIGELLFLSNFAIKKYGEEAAIEGWSGSEKTAKDFSFPDNWYEIKTVSCQSPLVTISSFEQLDSPLEGFLVVFLLEKGSSMCKGINLYSLVNEIDHNLVHLNSKLSFRNKLLDAGYCYGNSDNDRYTSPIFYKKETMFYKIDNRFPVIKRDDVDSRISKVTFAIDLCNISELAIKEGEL